MSRAAWFGAIALASIATLAHADPAPPSPAPDPSAPSAPLRSSSSDPRLAGGDRSDGRGTTGMIAFTFDDGPKSDTTPEVLAALAKYDVPAAFFIVTARVTGKHADEGRALVADELAAGHLVGSHTMNHASLTMSDPKALTREIDRSIEALADVIGGAVHLFRPPYGALGKAAAARLRKLELTPVLWDIDPKDWMTPKASELRNKIVGQILALNGGVIILHDTKKATARALVGVLDDLERHNCAQLAAGKPIITPVSLHYFLRRAGEAIPIPPEVAARTDNYMKSLPDRCRARPDAPPAAP